MRKKMFFSIILLLCSLMMLITTVYSWFTVIYSGSNGLNVKISDENLVTAALSYDGVVFVNNPNLDLNNFFSGASNSKKIYVRCTNNDVRNLNLTLVFRSPDGVYGEEKAFIDEEGIYGDSGLFYYLGSQIRISQIKATVGGVSTDIAEWATGLNNYLVTTSSENVTKGQDTGVVAAVSSIPRLDIVRRVPVAAGKQIIFEIDITFTDNGKEQNVYQNSADFICKRSLVVEW